MHIEIVSFVHPADVKSLYFSAKKGCKPLHIRDGFKTFNVSDNGRHQRLTCEPTADG